MIKVYENIYSRDNMIHNIIYALKNSDAFDNIHMLNDNTIAVDYADYDELGNDIRATINVDDDSVVEIVAPDDIKFMINNLLVTMVPSYNRFIQ